jgi:hypothetical protein
MATGEQPLPRADRLLPADAGHPLLRAAAPGLASLSPLSRKASAGPLRMKLGIEALPELHALRWTAEAVNTAAEPAPDSPDASPPAPPPAEPARLTAPASLDLRIDWRGRGAPTVHHMATGPVRDGFPPVAFAPRRTTLTGPAGTITLSSAGRDLPMAVISDEAGRVGLFAGLEWPGDWALEIALRDGRLHLTAGPVGVDAGLLPGESVPLPPAFVGFYTGDHRAGADALRRFLRSRRGTAGTLPPADAPTVGADVERLHSGSETAKKNPDWLLFPADVVIAKYAGRLPLDFSREDVRAMAVAALDRVARKPGLGRLRLEGHPDPGPLLSAADEPGRAGLTALRHWAGLAAVYGELRRRHPAAALEFGRVGGRRLDGGCWAVADSVRLFDAPPPSAAARRMLLGACEFLPAERLSGWSEAFGAVPPIPAGDCYAVLPTPQIPDDPDGRQFHDPASDAGLLLLTLPAAAAVPPRLHGLSPERTYRFLEPGRRLDLYRTGRMLMGEGLDLPAGLSGVVALEYKRVS